MKKLIQYGDQGRLLSPLPYIVAEPSMRKIGVLFIIIGLCFLFASYQ